MLRRVWEEKKRRENPKEYEQKQQAQERQLREFLRGMNIEVEESTRDILSEYEEEEKEAALPPPPPVHPPPVPSYLSQHPREPLFAPEVEEFVLETDVEQQRYIARTGRGFVKPFGKVAQLVEEKYQIDPLYLSKGGKGSSMAADILYRLPSPQDMVVLSEIFGKPKGY